MPESDEWGGQALTHEAEVELRAEVERLRSHIKQEQDLSNDMHAEVERLRALADERLQLLRSERVGFQAEIDLLRGLLKEAMVRDA